MDQNINIAAYHEAGHALVAYIVGWSVPKIVLTIENGTLIQANTAYDNGDDKNYVDVIKSFPSSRSMLNGMTSAQKKEVYMVSKKMHLCVIAGPMAQYYFEHGISNTLTFALESDQPDFKKIQNIVNCQIVLGLFDQQEFHSEELEIAELVQAAWKSIELLAQKILASETGEIKSDEIEAVFKSTGISNGFPIHL
ncbi:MAG: hypothetical protein EOO45_02215 [Flavobacterium sp.]|nr:MAG: hypothetical protein EOO45_02215 [Flavobacterium sp.]